MEKNVAEGSRKNLWTTEEVQKVLEEARKILGKQAVVEDGLYLHIRYVKKAAKIAYDIALVILDEYLRLHEEDKFVRPKDMEEYQARITKHNRKLLLLSVSIYDRLYIVGYYHGTRSVSTIRKGLNNVSQMLTYI